MNNRLEIENNFDNNVIEKITLDTHIIIWYLEGIKLVEKQISLIDNAREC